MSFTTETPNYGLPQYTNVKIDEPSWTADISPAFLTIDENLYSHAQELKMQQQVNNSVNNSLSQLKETQDDLHNNVEQYIGQTVSLDADVKTMQATVAAQKTIVDNLQTVVNQNEQDINTLQKGYEAIYTSGTSDIANNVLFSIENGEVKILIDNNFVGTVTFTVELQPAGGRPSVLGYEFKANFTYNTLGISNPVFMDESNFTASSNFETTITMLLIGGNSSFCRFQIYDNNGLRVPLSVSNITATKIQIRQKD